MRGKHVTRLFSAALDGELTGAAAERFQRHLAVCGRCAEDWAVFRSAVSALHELAPQRMPRPVHIPTVAAPVRRAAPVHHRLRLLVGGGGAGLAAAGAIAAVVLLALGHHPASGGSSSAAFGPAATPGTRVGAGASGATPCVATVPVVRSATAPAGFENVVTTTDPTRPGERLVVATPGSTVSPGGTLPVYAALSANTSGSGQGSCLQVSGVQTAGPLHAPSRANPAEVDGGGALYSVTVPPGTAPGTVVHIVVSFPAGDPAAGAQPLNAVVTVTVTR